MDRSKNRWRSVLACLFLGGLILASFWPVLKCEFVSYDDVDYVVGNPHVVQGLSWASIQWAFTHAYVSNWHPLTWISHMLDVQFFGLQPRWHHLTNLLFHTTNALLLFGLLRQLTGAFWRSLLVAALFGVHPLHVESVAWVAERKDVLSTFFFLLTLIAYTAYAHSPSQGLTQSSAHHRAGFSKAPSRSKFSAFVFYSLALGLFACGLMSKPMLVTLPFVLLLLDYWPLERLSLGGISTPSPLASRLRDLLPLLWEKVPFFALSVLSSIVTFQAQRGAGAVVGLDVTSPEFRLSNALIAYVRYIGMAFWPTKLAAFYPCPSALEWPLEYIAGAVLALVLVSIVCLYRFKTSPHFLVGWLWYLGTLVPAIGLIQVGQQALADRYTYIPLIGLFVLGVWEAASLLNRQARFRNLAWGVAILCLASCAWLTFRQTGFWENSRILFERAAAVTPNNSVVQNNLGVCLLDKGDFAEAAARFLETLRLEPKNAKAMQNLGICYAHQGDTPRAVEFYLRSIEVKPSFQAHYNLALLRNSDELYPDAEAHLLQALALSPDAVAAWLFLGQVETKLNNPQKAVEAYERALRIRPDNPSAHLSLGVLLVAQESFERAISHFEAGISQAEDNADVQLGFAIALSAQKRFPEAEQHYRNACRLEPTNALPYEGLGLSLFNEGKLTDSVTPLKQAIQLHATAKTHYFLALALHAGGLLDEALQHYRYAVAMNPNDAIYLNDLAWLLATHPDPKHRSGSEAVTLALKACKLAQQQEPRFWGTLDAAYAETGDFERAIQAAHRAHELALKQGATNLAVAAEERIGLYRSARAFHQSAETPTP